MAQPPTIVVIGGPNGAGKTTISRAVLADTLGITEFVNADAIAAGLSGFAPDRAAFAAGRVMLTRLHELAAAMPPTSFAFESTLASRTFAPWLESLVARGWQVHVIYIWLRSPALAVRRVKARVRKGGHSIHEPVIRRRYARSAANFWRLYRPLAEQWHIFDNSTDSLSLVASGARANAPIIVYPDLFAKFRKMIDAHETPRPDSPDDA